MGHYDSCREAEEKYEIEKKGANLRDILLNRTDEEIGQFAEAYETIDKVSREMMGKEKHHDKLKAARSVLSRFFTNINKRKEGRYSFDDHHIGWIERDSGGALSSRIIENPGLKGQQWYDYAQTICGYLNKDNRS